MVKVTLHGEMGRDLGETWNLEINSIAEAFRAIEANTRKLRKWVMDRLEEFEYEILINKNLIKIKNPETIEELLRSELFLIYDAKNLKSIDLVPIPTGSGKTFKKVASVVGGVALVAGAVLGGAGAFGPGAASAISAFAPSLILGGLSLVSAGVTSLLAKPPPLVPYQAQQATTQNQGAIGQGGGPQSYLFNGPVNTVGEGGPVPVGYGTLMVGSTSVNVYYTNTYVVNRRNTYQNPNFGTYLQDTSYGYQNYFNEQMTLISQRSSFIN